MVNAICEMMMEAGGELIVTVYVHSGTWLLTKCMHVQNIQQCELQSVMSTHNNNKQWTI